MRVREYMTPNPVTVTPQSTALEAAQKMYGGGFRHLPVLEGGHLVGIVSDRDLRGAAPMFHGEVSLERRESTLSTVQVAALMTRGPRTIEADSPVRPAAVLLSEGGFGALPVLEGGRLVGLFTLRDLLRWVLELTKVRL